jgi:hypothetical protein
MADSARLETGTAWCGVGHDDLFGHGARFYLVLRFESLEPQYLTGRFETAYQVTRRGEGGPFTGTITNEAFELTMESIDAGLSCRNAIFKAHGTIRPDGRILGVRLESSDPGCPVPGSSVQLYTAPEIWQTYLALRSALRDSR